MKLDKLRPAIDETLTAARMSGIVVATAVGNGPISVLAVSSDAEQTLLAPDSLFIIASLTKLATALAVLRLVDIGELALDDSLAQTLPEARASHPGVTLRRLLSHTAGLPIDVPHERAPYDHGLDWPKLAEACLQQELIREPGSYVQYGNVGYGLLALVVERITGHAFGTALNELVLQPLGVEAYLSAAVPRPATPLSDVRGSRVRSGLEPFNSDFYRSLALPWAGLLTTADGVIRVARAFNGHPAGFLSPALLYEATSDQTNGLPGGSVSPLIYPHCPWGLGPDLRGNKQPHWAPRSASPDSFGHAGASGCLAWCEPRYDLTYAFLGTRTADSGWLVRSGVVLGDAILGLFAAD
jgi:beta-lactamase class C